MTQVKLTLLLCLVYLTQALSAQIGQFPSYNGQNDSLQIINKNILDDIITNSQSTHHLIFIYTNYCSGTHYLLKDLNSYISTYGEKLNIILASSEPYREIPTLRKLLKKYAITLPKTYIIDSKKYKDKRLDSRKKGYKFRNDICKECQSDIIGVPYCLLYAKNKQLIYHGYRGRTNFDSLLNSVMAK